MKRLPMFTMDPKIQRRRALAKIYGLLIKLANEKPPKTKTTLKNNRKSARLKSNIPSGR